MNKLGVGGGGGGGGGGREGAEGQDQVTVQLIDGLGHLQNSLNYVLFFSWLPVQADHFLMQLRNP